MFILRVLFAVLLGAMLRRLYLSVRRATATGGKSAPKTDPVEAGYEDLTEQGIDDADFEEIP